MTVSVSAIRSTPISSVSLSGIEPANRPVSMSVSVSVTVSPLGSESDSIVISAVSTRSLSVFKPQSLTWMVAVLSQAYSARSSSTVPASKQMSPSRM